MNYVNTCFTMVWCIWIKMCKHSTTKYRTVEKEDFSSFRVVNHTSSLCLFLYPMPHTSSTCYPLFFFFSISLSCWVFEFLYVILENKIRY